MKEYHLTLNKETFIWIKHKCGIVYNSMNFEYFVFPRSNVIDTIYRDITNLDNLYCVVITEDTLKEVEVFVNNIQKINAGSLIEKTADKSTKPISYMPVLRIQEDISVLRHAHASGEQTNNILKCLTEITVHINGDTNIDPLIHKQFTAPSDSSTTLSAGQVKNFLDKCGIDHLLSLNVVGDFSTYDDHKELFDYLHSCEVPRYNVITTISSWLDVKNKISNKLNHTGSALILIVDNNNLLPLLPSKDGVKFLFPVDDKKSYLQAIKSIEDNSINCFEVIPIKRENNDTFFENYVYTTIEDFHSPSLPSKREIFSNQVINNNFFGKLTIMPNGKVYAGLNHQPIGTIHNSLYSLIYNELNSGASWRMIRDKQPCVNCIYQWLCPSPSNYELICGKNNLCHVWSE